MSFASCYADNINADSKQCLLNKSENADYIFEGVLISSARIFALDGDTVISLRDASKVEKNLSDHERVEVWMDVIEVSKVYKGNLENNARYVLFYRMRHPELANAIELGVEVDRYVSKSLKGNQIGTNITYLIKVENFKMGGREFPISVSSSILIETARVPQVIKAAFKN